MPVQISPCAIMTRSISGAEAAQRVAERSGALREAGIFLVRGGKDSAPRDAK
jgi:hypothetical protein